MALIGSGLGANNNRAAGRQDHIRHSIALICCGSYLMLLLQLLPSTTLARAAALGTHEHSQGDEFGGQTNGFAPTEDYFNQILTDLCNTDQDGQPGASCARRPTDIQSVGRKIERVTGKLADLCERDERLLESMQTALEVENIASLKAAWKPERISGRTRSVLDALVVPSRASTSIVRRALTIDVDTLRSQIGEDFITKLPANDRRIWLDASKELISTHVKSAYNQHETAGSVLLKLGTTVGSTLLDHFYSTPEFILNIPIIGEKLVELKRKSEPIYHAIELIRHSHAYFKLKAAETEAKLIGHDKLANQLRAQSQAARRLISVAGSNMFQTLVERLMIGIVRNHYKVIEAPNLASIKQEDKLECMIRLFYAVFSQVVSSESSQCSQAP